MSEDLRQHITARDAAFAAASGPYPLPAYDPSTHYLELSRAPYYRALLVLRHCVKLASDAYFSGLGATTVDLFMMTPSVSSPMGPGSDSEAVPITFGSLQTYLVDSSQFGFEPLLMNGLDKVYCYLPSIRGENPDKRHLNQFFHCEAEIRGGLAVLLPIVEGYVQALCEVVGLMPNVIDRVSVDPAATRAALARVRGDAFKRISFDEAVETLRANFHEALVRETAHGRDLSSDGELELARALGMAAPFWVTSYDRDRVAFYQKPDPDDSNKVLNADLLFPPIREGAFGGEIAGSGQRQDNAEEMHESLRRQGIASEPYEWYISLRKLPTYSTTSGFGLGIERFITWILGRDDIKDAIIYPRLKNVVTHP